MSKMIEYIKAVLPEQYGLEVNSVKEVRGGWSAFAFVADTDKGRRFVKIFDKGRPSVQSWIDRIDLYMPAVLWLSGYTPMKDKMNAPVLTKNHAYKTENAAYIMIVFPIIDGKTLCETRLTVPQIHQLANILAQLHSYGSEIPVSTKLLTETYTLPFLEGFPAVLDSTTTPTAMQEILRPYSYELKEKAEQLKQLVERLRQNPPRYRLCHTDVHGWNLMWSEKLILIDWEGLRLAPVEADLFAFSEGFFFDYASEEFYKVYKKVHPEYVENKPAMTFYRLRRRLEDIAEFAYSIVNDGLSEEKMKDSLKCLEEECVAIQKMEIVRT